MKTKLITTIIAAILLICAVVPRVSADDKPAAKQRYEYAIIKYDGPDRIQIMYPNQKVDMYRVFDKGVKLPADAKQEEFCVTYAVNELAKDWLGSDPTARHARHAAPRVALTPACPRTCFGAVFLRCRFGV